MVRFIRYIILIALLQAVAGIFLSHAQSFTSASGIVKDSITGEPLPFVSVYFDGSTIGAMTDDNGNSPFKTIRAIPNWPPPHWDTILNSSISSPVKRMTIWKYC